MCPRASGAPVRLIAVLFHCRSNVLEGTSSLPVGPAPCPLASRPSSPELHSGSEEAMGANMRACASTLVRRPAATGAVLAVVPPVSTVPPLQCRRCRCLPTACPVLLTCSWHWHWPSWGAWCKTTAGATGAGKSQQPSATHQPVSTSRSCGGCQLTCRLNPLGCLPAAQAAVGNSDFTWLCYAPDAGCFAAALDAAAMMGAAPLLLSFDIVCSLMSVPWGCVLLC